MDDQNYETSASQEGGEEQRPQVLRAGQGFEASAERLQEQADKATVRVLRAGEHATEQLEQLAEKGARAAEQGAEAAGQTARTLSSTARNAYQQALEEWAGFTTRTLQRNAKALMELPYSRNVGQLFGRQAQLVVENTDDWMQTSLATVRAFSHRAGEAAEQIRSQAR